MLAAMIANGPDIGGRLTKVLGMNFREHFPGNSRFFSGEKSPYGVENSP
jgi:hypothetical protein